MPTSPFFEPGRTDATRHVIPTTAGEVTRYRRMMAESALNAPRQDSAMVFRLGVTGNKSFDLVRNVRMLTPVYGQMKSRLIGLN
uniref:Uncharacterized protein n=1 Tax=viral metagenome TaxID=1070528 RepID=A0A6C0J563_9ZZZZ